MQLHFFSTPPTCSSVNSSWSRNTTFTLDDKNSNQDVERIDCEMSRLNLLIADLYDRERLQVELHDFYEYTTSICTWHPPEFPGGSLEAYPDERPEESSSGVGVIYKHSNYDDDGYDQNEYREPQSESKDRTTSSTSSREKEEDTEPIPSLTVSDVQLYFSQSRSSRRTTQPTYDKSILEHVSNRASKHKSSSNLSIIELKAKKRLLERQQKLGGWNSDIGTE